MVMEKEQEEEGWPDSEGRFRPKGPRKSRRWGCVSACGCALGWEKYLRPRLLDF